MKTFKKRILAGISAFAFMVTLTANMLTVFAGGDTLPPREGEQGYKGENQPSYHGYRAMDILNWTPDSDEFSGFTRAQVPLQERNEAFNATQANPLLNQEVESLTLAGDYGNDFFDGYQYNDEFAPYVFNFWQYLDYRASWHGMVTNPTPDSLFDPEAGWWERQYEFGILNLPNPGYTNAAHKNGVKSLGCIFFPRSEHTDDLVYKDENGRFPMADKLVEIAKYYGFDGYFLNAEEYLPGDYMPLYEEFVRAMTSQGIYTQVYASNQYGQNNQASWGRINYYQKDATLFSNWVKDPEDETVAANSLYMNPDPSKEMVNGSVSIMESLGLDARQTVFNTLEAGQTGFSGNRGSLYNLFDENLVPRTAIAHLGTEHVWSGIDENIFGHSGSNSYEDNRRGDPAYQKYVFARERTWWSGSQNQPYYTGDSSYVEDGVTYLNKSTKDYTEEERSQLLKAILDTTTNPYDTANNPDRAKPNMGNDNEGKSYQSWPGLAAFISERSVINGTSFNTNFNTGHGMQYFTDGEISNENEWGNINIQDILPTWQWWTQTADESEATLSFDFDYGKKYSPAFEHNQIGGYNGGSSLVTKGSLSVEHLNYLYKTKLDIKDNSNLDITYYKSSADDTSEMKIAIIFEDAPENVEYITVENSGKQSSDWTTATFDLSAYKGRTLAAFGLAFDPNGENIADYQMNIGEITIADNKNAPSTPTGLNIDKAFDNSETYISWDIADYDTVQKYNVYAVYEDGKEVYLGGTYDDVYYIKSLYNPKGTVKIKVTAENANGVESEAATVTRNFDITASNISVKEGNGSLNVSWTNPKVKYDSIRADVTLPYNHYGNSETYSEVFTKSETNGIISVPVTDGSKYNVRLSYIDDKDNVVSYTDYSGQLKDLKCDNYKGKITISDIGKGWKIQNPLVYDWWHLYAWNSDGTQIKFGNQDFAIRGVNDLTGLRLSGTQGHIEIQLEDFAGNKSEKIPVFFGPNPERDALEFAINEADLLSSSADFDSTYTKESIAGFRSALENAKAVFKLETTTEAECLAAKTVLQDATDNLMDVEVYYGKQLLQKVIDEAERLKADGTLESAIGSVVKEFNAALIKAKEVMYSSEVTIDEVKDATLDLLGAIGKVDWKKGDKSELIILVELAEITEAELDKYVEKGKQEFIDALTKARKVMADEDALENEVNEASDKLFDAWISLRYKINKTLLKKEIDRAQAVNRSLFTEVSLKSMDEGLEEANRVYKDKKSDQKKVDDVSDNLKKLVANLELKEPVDKGNSAGDDTKPILDNTAGTKTVETKTAETKKPNTATEVKTNKAPKTGEEGFIPLVLVFAATSVFALRTLKRRKTK